jgi:hypothetical protein
MSHRANRRDIENPFPVFEKVETHLHKTRTQMMNHAAGKTPFLLP